MGHARFQPFIRDFGLRFECQIYARYPSSTALTFLFWGLRLNEEKGYPYYQGIAVILVTDVVLYTCDVDASYSGFI